MTAVHQLLAGMSNRLWPGLLDHLWQGTLFAVVVWVFCLLAKPISSKTRYGIWLLASFKFAVPATVFLWLLAPLDIKAPWPKQTLSSSSTRVLLKFPLTKDRDEQVVVIGKSEPNIPTTEATHRELYCGLTLVWVLGCVFFFRVWWYRHRAMRARIREGEPIVSERTLEILSRVKARLDQRRPLALILSRDFDEPGVYGIQRPKLVLPKGVVDALTDQELEAVFLHEVAHVRRCDNLASLFHTCLCCVFWFHPVIWLIDRKLLVEREYACDEEVLSRTSNYQGYLSSLLKVLRWSLGKKVAGVSFITGSNLNRRIDHMRSHSCRKSSVAWHRLMITGFVLGWIISVVATISRNDKVLVAQQRPSAIAGKDGKLQSEAKGSSEGVNSVADETAGGAKGEGAKRYGQSSGPLRLAMNQTPPNPAPQAGSAKVFGIVYDASRARVPDATVVISGKEGGTKEVTISGMVGEYEFRALPVGRYSIEVRSRGFRAFQQAVELHANEPRELDAVLEVGEVNETLNVVAKAPPAVPPDQRSGPPRRIRVGGNVQATKLVHQVNPVYPERAQAQGIQGTVLLEAVIFKDGSLGALRVLNKLTDPELVEAAIEAVKNWRYEPTLLNGQPIEVVTTITINFRLS